MKNKVVDLANKVVSKIKPFCKRIEIAGSIRRGSVSPRDIDIVLIPKDTENFLFSVPFKSGKFEGKIKIENEMKKLGKFIQGGEKKSRWILHGIQTELYYTNEQEWGATLLAYSSKKGSAIGLRIVARLKGLKLTQHGLFNRKTGKFIAGKTEHDIYKALGRPYKLPENR